MDYPVKNLIPIGNNLSMAEHGDDASLFVEFYWREVQNEQKSEKEGRPIFESREYVKIIAPGDKTKQWDRPVRKTFNGVYPADTERWPRQYQAFLNQQAQILEGTPLSEWPAMPRSDAASLKALNIHTVEQLASLNDTALTWFGARTWRDRAKIFIEQASKGVDALTWAKEKGDLQAQVEALSNQLKGMTEAGIIPKQEASAPPKKRGRPKVINEQNIPPVDPASS